MASVVRAVGVLAQYMKCTWKSTLWQGVAGFSAIATSLLLRRSAWHFFYYVLPDTRRIKRINKDMKLILYSPGIWVIHSRRTYSQYDRNAKQTNDNL